MLFDGTIHVMDIQVFPGEGENMVIAPVIAFSLPAGPAGQVPIPFGVLRIPLTKKPALELCKRITEVAEGLTEQSASDLVVAQNLSGVDRAAAVNERFRKG